MNRNRKDLLAYAVVFFMGFLSACVSNLQVGLTNNSAGAVLRMFSSSRHRTAIFPTNTGNQPVVAELFK